MTKKEEEELFQSVIDDIENGNMFVYTPDERVLGELIDDFISSYQKATKLVIKFCKYYAFSKILQEVDSDNNDLNVEKIMNQLENSIKIHSEKINRLFTKITNEVNRNNQTNNGLDITQEERKQRFIDVFQKTKTEIDRMSNISNSLNILINSRNQLLNLLEDNNLLTESEVNLLK